MKYIGTIIEESLKDKEVLKHLKIIETKIEPVIGEHHTPWLKQWTLHKVEIYEEKAEIIAQELQKSLETKHIWYADYKNPENHYIIFPDKIFKIKRNDHIGYQGAKEYGISLGIPDYQVDFSPDIK